MIRCRALLILAVVFTAVLQDRASLALEQVPPPPGVATILNDINLLEQYFEKEEWDDARIIANRIDNELLKVFVATGIEDVPLEKSLVSLKGALYEGSIRKTEGRFLLFQRQFYSFLDNFAYDVHPILAAIDRAVNADASVAFAADDYGDVASEMAEAGNLLKAARPLFQARGVSTEDFDRFNAMVVGLVKDIKKGETGRVGEQLQALQELYGSFNRQDG